MDCTEKFEQRKKIRKMSYRMLWADFKDLVCSWKVILILLMYLFIILLPYYKGMEDYNAVGMYCLVIWVFMSLGALTETSFNYLPLSTEDIVYYLKHRTNHIEAWMVLISGASAVILDAFGVDVFWERGLVVLIFLLATVEWYFFMALYDYSKPKGTSFLDDCILPARKVRIAIYMVYSVILLFVSMLVGMFMDYNENVKIELLVIACAYLVMFIFRADAASWVRFHEYSKAPGRSMWGQQTSDLLKDMVNQQ